MTAASVHLLPLYRPRDPQASDLWRLIDRHFETFQRVYDGRFQAKYGYWRPIVERSVMAYLRCGDLHEGFARVRCGDCGHEMFVAFSCKQRCTCPSCHQKRTLLTAIHVAEDVCPAVHVENIVWPVENQLKEDDSGQLVADSDWENKNTSTWEGFALTDAWRIDKALVDYITTPSSKGNVETVHPDAENNYTACTTGADLSPINGDYGGFTDGFTMEFDYSFERSRGDGTTGWVKIIKDGNSRYLISNVGNSGVKFGVGSNGEPLEAAILDVEKMATKAGGIQTLLSYVTSDGSVDFPDALDPTYETEPVHKLMTGVLYAGSYPHMEDCTTTPDDPDTQTEYQAVLENNHKRAAEWGQNDHMKIDVTKTATDTYTVKIFLDGDATTYEEPGVTLTSLNSLSLQTHWGSGVIFSNMSVTKK